MVSVDELLEHADLYQTVFPQGWKFTYKLLTLHQYKVFRALRDSGTLHPFFVYRMVFDKCLLGDSKLLNDSLPAGVVVSVGELIMYLSGDCHNDTIKSDLTLIRENYGDNDLIELMKRVICLAFPTVDWFKLESLTRPELLHQFVQAESMLVWKTAGNYKPIDLNKIGVVEQETYKPVNFNLDNQQLSEQMDPFFEVDESERAYQQKKKLTPELAKKLDRARRAS